MSPNPKRYFAQIQIRWVTRCIIPFSISYKTLQDHAFTVTGGEVAKARRLNPPSSVGWEITINPTSDADVTIMLPVTTDCAADGAVCTQDGRKLSNQLELTVSGPGG